MLYQDLSDEALVQLYDKTYQDWEKYEAITKMRHKKLIKLTLEIGKRILG